jgi:hypothetical protein
VNKAKLTPTDRNNPTDEKLLSVALFLFVGRTCFVCKEFCVSKSQKAKPLANILGLLAF